MPIKVLYEDNHLIVVYKPAGILIQGDKSNEISLMDNVKDYLRIKYNKQGNIFLGLIHRLDRNVDGIIIFAKTSKGASRISEQFRNHTIKKEYHAWVHGILLNKRSNLINYLIHNEIDNISNIYDKEVKDSQKAELDYELIKEEDNFSLLKIILKTGRHHQIRSQLSHINHPIVGDIKYGSNINFPDRHIMLTATSLSFDTATDKKRISLSIEIPKKSW